VPRFFDPQIRPRIRNQILSRSTAGLPLLRRADECFHHGILFNIISHVFKLLGRLNVRVVITVLPRSIKSSEQSTGFAAHIAHRIVHEFRQGPRLTQCKERVPVIRHYDERAEVNAIVFDRKTERGDYLRTCFCIENWFLRMQ